MTPEETAKVCTTWAAVLQCTIPFFLIFICTYPLWSDSTRAKAFRWVLIFSPLLATIWLWAPFAVYGVVRVARLPAQAIIHLETPPAPEHPL